MLAPLRAPVLHQELSQHRGRTGQQHYPHVLVWDGSSPGSQAQGVQLGSLLSRARAQQPPSVGTAYLSLCMSWQRLMSGTEITPQRLYWPSPMERETSSTPRTLPSLHKETEHQFPSQNIGICLTGPLRSACHDPSPCRLAQLLAVQRSKNYSSCSLVFTKKKKKTHHSSQSCEIHITKLRKQP